MNPLARFVPACPPLASKSIRELQRVLADVDKLLVLTGAGISTESGIPDYRSERVGQYARTPHRPITIEEFMTSEWWRRRFWARNYVAWPRFRNAPCNETHYKLADWERSERFHWLITQNVDGLHSLAGSQKLTELHGCGRAVVCMECGEKYSRDEVQMWITELNPDWTVTEIGELAPDGDVPISEQALHAFKVPYCRKCGPNSILKTDVVFFGDNVSRNVVDRCHEMVGPDKGMDP
ncbi:sirtuin 4 [Aphelenchoides avenae]|nr:sirtuin 4 [Aphelenchus avenae]